VALADTLRFHRTLFAMNLKTALANRGAFWMNVVFMFLNDAIWFSVWLVFFARYPTIGGFSLTDMALLQGVLATAFGVGVVFAAGVRELARMIADGELDTFLTQPKPPLAHVVASRMMANGLGDIAYGVLLTATFADVHGAAWAWLPVGVLAGSVVWVSFGVLVHSIAFWAGPFQALAKQLNEILITVTNYPDRMYGGALRVALFTVLPAGLLAWLPAQLVRDPSLANLASVLGGAAGLAIAARLVFRAGLRRYESGSRFGSMT
jgi:ABC-2 type transport system permease protein